MPIRNPLFGTKIKAKLPVVDEKALLAERILAKALENNIYKQVVGFDTVFTNKAFQIRMLEDHLVIEFISIHKTTGEHKTMFWLNQQGQLDCLDKPAYLVTGHYHHEAWFRNGSYCRDNGPTYITNAVTRWHLDNKLHRTDGPAVVWKNGRQDWFQNNVLHREDGPAIVSPSGECRWFLHGIEFSALEHQQLTKTNSDKA